MVTTSNEARVLICGSSGKQFGLNDISHRIYFSYIYINKWRHESTFDRWPNILQLGEEIEIAC